MVKSVHCLLRLRLRWQLHPPPGGGIAHNKMVIMTATVVTAVEKEAIASVHQGDALILVRMYVREGRVEGGCAAGETGEVVAIPAVVEGRVEEAGKGLGQLLVVGGVGDEVAPEH